MNSLIGTSLVIALIMLVLMGAGLAYFFVLNHADERTVTVPTRTPTTAPKDGGVFCTQDAMECPDGSYVGRVGPNCEFAPCPGL